MVIEPISIYFRIIWLILDQLVQIAKFLTSV